MSTRALKYEPQHWWETITRPIRFRRRHRILAIAAIGAIIVFCNMTSQGTPTNGQRILASLIIVVASIPTFRWLATKDHFIPLVPFFAFMYTVYFALGTFFLRRFSIHPDYGDVSDRAVTLALFYSLVGLIAFLTAYYGFPRKIGLKVLPKVRMNWPDYSHVAIASLVLFTLGIVVYWMRLLVEIPLTMQNVVNLVTDVAIVAMIALFVVRLRGSLGTTGSILLVLAIVVRVLMGLATHSVGELLRMAVPLILAYAAIKRRIPWKAIVVVGALFFVLRPVKGELGVFEPLGRPGEARALDSTPVDAGARYVIGAVEFLWSGGYSPSEVVLMSFPRLAQLMTFARTIDMTPEVIPYWKGETIYPILYKPIPRILYPDKPVDAIGVEFRHAYGFVLASDYTTYITVPLVVDFYGNFGLLGVALGMMFVGAVVRAIEYLLVHPSMGIGAFVVCLHLHGKIAAAIENNLSGVFGVLVQTVPVLIVIHLIMTLSLRKARTGMRSTGPLLPSVGGR